MRKNLIRSLSLLAATVLLAGVGIALAAAKKGEDQNVRSVQGTVSDANETAVNGAVVQIKNTKTLQIRSFITKDNGAYYFNGLSPDVDYEIKADFQGATSPTKKLSSFDSRKQVVLNLKLPKK
jgi:Carboxypeptidase regulatory-like domain